MSETNLINGIKVKLQSSKGDYLHRPDSADGVTTWVAGTGNEWTVEFAGDKIRLKSWKGDYLHRADLPQGVTTCDTGIGNEWTVERAGDKLRLKSWKGDYLHRPDSPQGVTMSNSPIDDSDWLFIRVNVKANVGISQLGMIDANRARFKFRNLGQSDVSTATFNLIAVDARGNAIPSVPVVEGLKDGGTFVMPAGNFLNVLVLQMSGAGQGARTTLTLQPYVLVAANFDIFHFYHEEATETCWAIGSPVGNKNKVCVLRSTDYFTTFEERGSITIPDNDANLKDYYRSIYVDKYRNVIIGWRPGPMISRDGGFSFEHMFDWLDPNMGMLWPFWNITENDNGLMVISEYGASEADTRPDGSHRGTFWSSDPERRIWQTKVVGRGFDSGDANKFGGYYRHIHGYHINPDLPHVHHMFLGDYKKDLPPGDGTPGYYVSENEGVTWSSDILKQWPGGDGEFYNGPCFVTWWPNGKAFIVSDTARAGSAYWWGSGPGDWGGQGFEPAVELRRDVDNQSQSPPETPWMAMAVRGSYETYCTTSTDKSTERLWRYDAYTRHIQVLAEVETPENTTPENTTLKWLSGSRHNRIPPQARYFFTSGNRRFPRL